MIELWHEWNSVHSFKVRVVLAEKGLAWESRRLELLKFEHLRAEYLRLNPNGVVPTLLHDGRVITESSVICQYLDDVFPSPRLLPHDPYQRAQARMWLKIFDDVAHPAIRKASFELLYRPLLSGRPQGEVEGLLAAHPNAERAQAFRSALARPADPLVVEDSKRVFKSLIARLHASLPNDDDWLAGREFSLADVAMAPFVERLDHLGMLELFQGKTARWSERVLARSSIESAKAPPAHRFPGPEGKLR